MTSLINRQRTNFIQLLSLPLLLCLLANSQVLSQKSLKPGEAIKKVSPEKIKEFLEYLASDELEGRCAGEKGNTLAAEYIAKHFENLKLEAVGNSYFQEFELQGKKVKNILAIYRGTHRKLKDEFIVIGAHMDHVGKKGQPNTGRIGKPTDKDDIWNGADDNASGTAAVMEIARIFVESKLKTKRSILFILFNAEEWGLIGSKYYLDNPPFPLKNHKAMINLDMVGRNQDKPVSISGVGSCELFKEIFKTYAREVELRVDLQPSAWGGSDHFSFLLKEIPAVHIFTGMHGDYHRITDHADKISYHNVAKICKMVILVAEKLANTSENIKWQNPPGFIGESPQLGVHLEEVPKEERKELKIKTGAVKVTFVQPGSVADKAGLKAADIIIEFNNKKLPEKEPIKFLVEQIRSVKYNKKIPIVIIRDGKKHKLHAIWEKKKK